MDTKTLDVASIRSEFPALDQVVEGRPLAYLDNAATTQRPTIVTRAMDHFYIRDNANVHRGVHLLSQRATDAYEAARRDVAAWVNAPTSSLVFTKGCTEAINLVALSWGGTNLKPGDVVLVSTMEHHSNIVPWQQIALGTGAKIVPIPLTDDLSIDLDWLSSHIDKRVRAVCVKAVCNVLGAVNPIADICDIAHKNGAVTMIDAAQALAHEMVDVQACNADFVAFAAHKAYGPMGVGALYGRPELLDKMPPYQTGGGMVRGVTFEKTNFSEPPERFEAGTPNVAGAIGFAAAVRFIKSIGFDAIRAHERELRAKCVDGLKKIEGVKVFGEDNEAPVVSFAMDVAHSHDVGTVLDKYGVAVRTGHHCCMPLMARLGVASTSRASFAVYNTLQEVDALLEAMQEVRRLFS